MPDKWEYPWYAAWDLAFHCVPLALVDSEFAKDQLVADAARVVHAPERAAAGVRVGARRREPAGARVGGVARLQDREEAPRRRRSAVPRARLPEAAAQFHVVGEPQGRRRAATSSKAASSAWTTSACSTASQPLPTGGTLRAVGRHQLDGDVHAEHAGDGDGAGATTTPRTRTSPASSGSTSSTSRHAMNDIGPDGAGAVGRAGRLLLRRAAFADGDALAAEGAVDGRADSAVRRGDARARDARSAAGLQEAPRLVRRASARPDRQRRVHADARAGRAPAALGRRPRAAAARALQYMLDEKEFLSPYGIRALSRSIASTPYLLGVDGDGARVDYEPAESTTGLFGGNSNWRGPIWFPVNYLMIESLQKFHHYFGDDVQGGVPDRLGRLPDARRGRDGAVAAAVAHLPRGDDGRRPAAAARSGSRAIRTGATTCCSTSTSTATPAPGSARAIRPDGPAWSPSCCSRAERPWDGAAGDAPLPWERVRVQVQG